MCSLPFKSIEHNPDLEYSNSNVIGANGQLYLAKLVNAKRCGWSKAMFFPIYTLSNANLLFSIYPLLEFDLILMDVYLNGYDGRKICKTLKFSEFFKTIPIILYTALSTTKISITDSLADAFLLKPFTFNEIYHLINLNIKISQLDLD